MNIIELEDGVSALLNTGGSVKLEMKAIEIIGMDLESVAKSICFIYQ